MYFTSKGNTSALKVSEHVHGEGFKKKAIGTSFLTQENSALHNFVRVLLCVTFLNILSMHINLSLCKKSIIWGKLGNPGHHWEFPRHTVV